MKILNLYCSMTGNTARIAEVIETTARSLEHEVRTLRVTVETEAETVDLLDCDFLFIGSGVYSWLPPEPMRRFLDVRQKSYGKQGLIRPASPRLPGKTAVAYATFGGPHTGINEGVITPKFLGQLPDHLGFEVVAEWLFPGEFNASDYEKHSVGGRMGDLRGRPDEHDLRQVAQMVTGVLKLRGEA